MRHSYNPGPDDLLSVPNASVRKVSLVQTEWSTSFGSLEWTANRDAHSQPQVAGVKSILDVCHLFLIIQLFITSASQSNTTRRQKKAAVPCGILWTFFDIARDDINECFLRSLNINEFYIIDRLVGCYVSSSPRWKSLLVDMQDVCPRHNGCFLQPLCLSHLQLPRILLPLT